jgi:hypothetical protein
LVCAIAASRSHPLGGYGVFNLFENRQLGTLKFTARSFRERHGREYFEGTVFEYTDSTLHSHLCCVGDVGIDERPSLRNRVEHDRRNCSPSGAIAEFRRRHAVGAGNRACDSAA